MAESGILSNLYLLLSRAGLEQFTSFFPHECWAFMAFPDVTWDEPGTTIIPGEPRPLNRLSLQRSRRLPS